MSTSVATYGKAYWLGVLFGVNAAPTDYWVALTMGQPGEDMDGVVLDSLEPADTYARQHVLAGATYWSDATSGVISNLAAITFPTPTVRWGQVTHFALCTTATNGDLYAYGEFDNSQVADTDNIMVIPAGGITLTISGPVPTIVN